MQAVTHKASGKLRVSCCSTHECSIGTSMPSDNVSAPRGQVPQAVSDDNADGTGFLGHCHIESDICDGKALLCSVVGEGFQQERRRQLWRSQQQVPRRKLLVLLYCRHVVRLQQAVATDASQRVTPR